MLVYTLLLAPIALVPVFLGVAGWVYGATAIALNLGFMLPVGRPVAWVSAL